MITSCSGKQRSILSSPRAITPWGYNISTTIVFSTLVSGVKLMWVAERRRSNEIRHWVKGTLDGKKINDVRKSTARKLLMKFRTSQAPNI